VSIDDRLDNGIKLPSLIVQNDHGEQDIEDVETDDEDEEEEQF